jgi:hypothetical protein
MGVVAVAVPAAANAASDQWGCTASALRAQLASQQPIEPLIANNPLGHTNCEADTAGANQLGPSVGNIVNATAVTAKTDIDPTPAPASQLPTA